MERRIRAGPNGLVWILYTAICMSVVNMWIKCHTTSSLEKEITRVGAFCGFRAQPRTVEMPLAIKALDQQGSQRGVPLVAADISAFVEEGCIWHGFV